jgi:hypothetical protein
MSNQEGAKTEISLFMKGEEGGTIQVDSVNTFDPFTADMKLSLHGLALYRFQPYIDPVAQLEVTEGTFSLDGTLTIPEESNYLPALRYQGGFTLDGVKTSDRRTKEAFFQWDAFESDGLTFDVEPNRLHVRKVTFKNPSARIVVDPEGETNAVAIFSPPRTEKGAESENLLEKLVDIIIAKIQGPVPLTVEAAGLRDLSVSFTDQSIKPPYSAKLLISEGSVKSLSSGSKELADVTVKGQIDRYASLQGKARMNPFLKENPEAEININLNNFDLKSVTPYSGKYVGYAIEHGKLNLDANYRLKEESINGDNRFLIKKFGLGPPVDSPDAVDLPIPLAVALLKDRKGNIQFDLNV